MFNVVVFAHLFGRTSCFGYATLLGDGRRVRAHLLGRVSTGGRQSAPPRTARENGDGEEGADATCTNATVLTGYSYTSLKHSYAN